MQQKPPQTGSSPPTLLLSEAVEKYRIRNEHHQEASNVQLFWPTTPTPSSLLVSFH